MSVFVLDKHKKPLMPCSEKRARLMLSRGRAIVTQLYPFTIRLKDRIEGTTQPLRIKIDPGSKQTGVALVRESKAEVNVLNLFQINHRGQTISKNLTSRQAMRKRRRSTLRYRQARFHNRTRKEGWLAPSLQHRVDTILSWVNKLQSIAPIIAISQEIVRFDMQAIQNPEISGVEYQRGNLEGYEIREYLLEKWGRKCVYCQKENIPLEIEHIHPKSRGGSDRVSNLTIACRPCNQKKGNQSIEKFLLNKTIVLEKIKKHSQKPLLDAAAVNSTRWTVANQLKTKNIPLELSSGGRTKFNRIEQKIEKSHALDAVCIGSVGTIVNWNISTLEINCTGRGSYQRTRLDKYGFPRGYLMRKKSVKGFQTGDIVKATVTKGKKTGTYKGRVAIRATGSFNITTEKIIIQGISHKNCQLIARNNGYGYRFLEKIKNRSDTSSPT
jgi:5-methylcytosine-specific restriction endonuclease McrA